ncbi:aspartyl-phosphate phosphatase Spo0E family protein [Paenibacillus gallinarum]|uniref:Aspartyl-phosphate phosphatase Spo0E family protein n=1 Tax=Paenibacillus gallinarum TaxID=2762232 RepID=A0ABR8T3A0_9BACL|nr:aspartyl-phosphate phosphatase Spo0E family protein [Paenibacillus gallinarum]MBD7970254.1 aspartyl-phosphate phosphatase Spo0E family protein [Paenibacillus gallinarum]
MENPSSLEGIQDQIQIIWTDLEALRSLMERIGSELGLLSQEVIEVSQKLDEKINQYILLTKQLKDMKKPTT